MKHKHYRQGDVLIERISELPPKLKKLKRVGGRLILAEGEVTGHHHAIADEHCALLAESETAQVTFLEIKEAVAALTHEEHSTITLPPGNYRVTRQREYSPEAIRRVAD